MSPSPVPLTRQRTEPPLRRRQAVPSAIARRRRVVSLTKLVLPLAALLLLATMALWPELSRGLNAVKMAAGAMGLPEAGQLTDATYHGVDQRGRPYTMTATAAHEVNAQRVDLTQPKGDITLEGNRWLMVQARNGVYMQHIGSLDLSGDVQLYRDDGTVMQTDTATLDLKAGAGSGADRVHVEGSFGTLDAQGFTMTDQGSLLHFAGPGHLVLNAGTK